MLVPVDQVPEGETTEHLDFVIGHSETGHHHVLESIDPFEVTEADEELYFRLWEEGMLVQKKEADRHKNLVVPAGIYKRYTDTEYLPAGDETQMGPVISMVAD